VAVTVMLTASYVIVNIMTPDCISTCRAA